MQTQYAFVGFVTGVVFSVFMIFIFRDLIIRRFIQFITVSAIKPKDNTELELNTKIGYISEMMQIYINILGDASALLDIFKTQPMTESTRTKLKEIADKSKSLEKDIDHVNEILEKLSLGIKED